MIRKLVQKYKLQRQAERFVQVEYNSFNSQVTTQTMPKNIVFTLGEEYIHPVSGIVYPIGTKMYDYDAYRFRPEGGQGGSSQFYEGIPHNVQHSPNINKWKQKDAYIFDKHQAYNYLKELN